MATIDLVKKFAEQAIKVEGVFRKDGIPGNAGRVIFVLSMANKPCGVSQKEVVDCGVLPKDQVSKLVGSLMEAELLTQERMTTNLRRQHLSTTDLGRDLLSRVKVALQPSRPARPAGKSGKPTPLRLFEIEDIEQ